MSRANGTSAPRQILRPRHEAAVGEAVRGQGGLSPRVGAARLGTGTSHYHSGMSHCHGGVLTVPAGLLW